MIRIELDELIMGLDNHEALLEYVLDKWTGKVIPLSDEAYVGDVNRDVRESMEREPERWLRIEPLPSRDGFRIMEDFVAGLPDGEQKRTLERTLSWKKPFSNFKRALTGMPELRQKWFAFQEECMRCHAERWLHGEGIEAELY